MYLLLAIVSIQVQKVSTQANNTSPQVMIQIGPVEVIRGPDNTTDSPFNTLMSHSELKAYLANSSTWGYVGASLETLRPLNNTIIQAGNNFDSCGAWLHRAWQDDTIVRGWYHAETKCRYPQTRKSIAYAESNDGGRTFVKPNYPNNQVIASPPRYTNPGTDDEGDHRIIRIGNYLYLYFLSNHQPSWQIYLARSHIRDKGLPGTWQKYYNGSFTQPGLGGEASPIASWNNLATSWVSYNSYLNSYIGFSGVWDNVSDRQKGFGLSTSNDGLNNWATLINNLTAQPYLLLSYEGSWDRQADDGDLLAYPSLVSVYGDTDKVGDVFWLYYMYLNPGDNFDRRYLVRRKIHIEKVFSSTPIDLTPRIALAKYQNKNDTWSTTKMTNKNYRYIEITGYLFTDRITNSKPVYDCYIDSWKNHMLTVDDQTCNGGIYLRQIGWISTVPFNNSIQAYQCWNSNAANHFISTDPKCEGAITQQSMGYLATMSPFPQNKFVALSSYYRSNQHDNRVTIINPPDEQEFESRIGYIFTTSRPNSNPVYDCYIPSWEDHMLGEEGECDKAGVDNLARIGWISQKPFLNSAPIYRCFDKQNTNHFISFDTSCKGKTYEGRVGYIATKPNFSNQQLYLPVILRNN